MTRVKAITPSAHMLLQIGAVVGLEDDPRISVPLFLVQHSDGFEYPERETVENILSLYKVALRVVRAAGELFSESNPSGSFNPSRADQDPVAEALRLIDKWRWLEHWVKINLTVEEYQLLFNPLPVHRH